MTDFVNVFESDVIEGRFLDARNNHVLITYPTSTNTSALHYSHDNAQTFTQISVLSYKNTLCRVSSDGQKMYIYSPITRKFQKSHDSGASWTHNKTRDKGRWYQISDDGQHQIFTREDSLLVSNDFADNFTEIAKSAQRCDCDASGQYMVTVAKINENFIINVSNDYGATFVEQIINGGGVTTPDCPVSMSKNGQYILVGARACNLFVSSDYGVSFQEITNINKEWKHVDISYLNAKFMYAFESQNNTYWVSEDFGQTWTSAYNHPHLVLYDNIASTESYLFAFNRSRNRIDRFTLTHSAPSGETSGGSGETSEETSGGSGGETTNESSEETSGSGSSEQSSAVVSVLYDTA